MLPAVGGSGRLTGLSEADSVMEVSTAFFARHGGAIVQGKNPIWTTSYSSNSVHDSGFIQQATDSERKVQEIQQHLRDSVESSANIFCEWSHNSRATISRFKAVPTTRGFYRPHLTLLARRGRSRRWVIVKQGLYRVQTSVYCRNGAIYP
ncbi:uncharacterized protein BKA78DRAFT_305715 [Phyllosticta capitalensis]|uniref:uncharacterized protein n=1 Tax=Phyllosticta capitalensis TaxID=121624 RepID=UPI00313015E8